MTAVDACPGRGHALSAALSSCRVSAPLLRLLLRPPKVHDELVNASSQPGG